MDNLREQIRAIRDILDYEGDLNERKGDINSQLDDMEETADKLEELVGDITNDLETELDQVNATINAHASEIKDILF